MLTPLLLALACLNPPAVPGAMAPHMAPTDGGVLLSWLEPADPDGDSKAMRLRHSTFDGSQWSPPVTVVQRNDFFANWADVPVVVYDDGSWTAAWLQKSGPGTYAYDIAVARSEDGRTWTHLGTLNDDRTMTEHGFVSLVPVEDGTHAFWLDGREMTGDGHGHGSGVMNLRTAMITDRVGESRVIDDMVCECCPTAAAATPNGPIVLVRDRTQEEVRDIEVLRASNDYEPGAMLHPDEWSIAGCPVNGPALDTRGADVAAAWFTGTPDRTGVWVAFSSDAGATFDAPIQVDGDGAIGRVDLVMLPDGRAVISWLRNEDDGTRVMLRTVGPDGHARTAREVASVDASRRSGIPRIATMPGHPDDLLVTWTDVEDSRTTLHAAVKPIDLPTKDAAP